ncbi:MAG: DUF1566 domain-containing protein [bacterium]
MNIIFSILLLCISFSEIRAQEEPDIYLTRAGWAKQDGGYMDPQTNIIWGPELDKTSWGEAKLYCERLVFGGRNDWRLPTVEELQRSVCKVKGYATRVACTQPRNHEQDVWLLNKDMKRGVTYWAGNLIPGDPYNAYYFVFDMEGQHIMTSKGDKSKARCVTMSKVGLTPAPVAAVAAAAATTPANDGFSFYISPLIGVGGFFTSAIQLSNTPYLNGELRLGFRMVDKLMFMFSGDTGFNLRDRSYPVVNTFSVGPEYFFMDDLSAFAAVGLGIVTANTNTTAITVTETRAGVDWKVGINWSPLRWGDKGQYGIPFGITYTGVKTQWVLANMVLFNVGFIYFN